MFIKNPDDFDEAERYKNLQRRLTPPVYNPCRVFEQPIPNTSQNSFEPSIPGNGEMCLVQSNEGSADDESDQTAAFDDFDGLDEIPLVDMMVIENEEQLDADPLAIKEEPINNHDIGAEIDILTHTRIIVVDDNVIMTFEDEKCFAPLKEVLVKRNDKFSGTIPYEEDVSIVEIFRFDISYYFHIRFIYICIEYTSYSKHRR